jgi:hypothetical protein
MSISHSNYDLNENIWASKKIKKKKKKKTWGKENEMPGTTKDDFNFHNISVTENEMTRTLETT